MFTKKKLLNIPTLLYVLTLPLLLIDVYKSDTTLYTYFHINSRFLVLVLIVLFCILRIFFKQRLSGFLSKINKYAVFPLSLGVGIILTLYDYLTPPNYVYSLFEIQYKQLFLIGLYSGILVFLEQSNDWFKKYYQQIIFISTFIALACAFITSLFPSDVFIKFSQEDNLIESSQVVVLLIGAFWAFRFSKILFRRKKQFHAVIFSMVMLGLIFISGDEISWGQRIFHIETPKLIAENSDQIEITIHNLSIFDQHVNFGYIAIGLYGAVMWLFPYVFSGLKKPPFYYYISPWFCSAYYFVGFAYNFYTRTHSYHTMGVWSELAELMLYTGIMFTMFNLYVKNKSPAN